MFLKHDVFMDACFKVEQIKNHDDCVNVYGKYWNLGQDKESWSMGIDGLITIDADNYTHWKLYVGDANDLRGVKWEELGAWIGY